MPSNKLLIVDRGVPDTIGARKIVISYINIVAIKFTDMVRNKVFIPLGFEERTVKRGHQR